MWESVKELKGSNWLISSATSSFAEWESVKELKELYIWYITASSTNKWESVKELKDGAVISIGIVSLLLWESVKELKDITAVFHHSSHYAYVRIR